MSEETNVDGVLPQNDGVKTEAQTVAYETFNRALNEKKRFQSEAEQLREKVAQLEASTTEKKTSFEEQLASYKQRYEESINENKSLKSTFFKHEVNSKIERELSKRGCKDPSGAIKLMDEKDYSSILSDVDDNLNVGAHTMDFALDKLQKDKSYLFGKKMPPIADALPGSGASEKPKPKAQELLEKMNAAETKEEYLKYEAEYIKLIK